MKKIGKITCQIWAQRTDLEDSFLKQDKSAKAIRKNRNRYLFGGLLILILWLVPYILLSMGDSVFLLAHGQADGVTFGVYLEKTLTLIWSFAKKYAPHLLSVYILLVAVLIFLEGKNPDRTVLWLLVLAFFPIGGILLYMLLGPDLKRLKNRKLFKPVKSYPGITAYRPIPKAVKKTSVLACRNSSSDVLEHGEAEILIDGEETFSAIKRELSAALRYIHIEYFIFKDDKIGCEIADILCERAGQGVKVRMAVDGVGTRRLGRQMLGRFKSAGVELKIFMPVSFPIFRSGINFRNHRKIVVVDGRVAFTGGLNVGDEYMGEGPLGYWRDTHALFKGDAVKALNAVFLKDWEICAGEKLSPDSDEFAHVPGEGDSPLPFLPVQIVESGSASPWHAIQQMYFSMIVEARERIWITTPYLVPDEAIFCALQTAALSGVDVRILMPAKKDHFLVYWAGRYNIEELLRSGVRIWRYSKGFVHAKTMVMDEAIASVGTTNLDNRSLEINFEVQAFIYDRQISEKLAAQFLEDIRDEDECLLREWEKRPLTVRMLESLGRLWSSQI